MKFLNQTIGFLVSTIGAWFNYILTVKLGKKIILKFLKDHYLILVENNSNIKQYISFPAKMRININK